MPRLPFPIRSSAALVAVGDPGRDRTVYSTIVLLVALGFAMILLAVWLLRTTRPDPEVLAPLERMGQRKWRRADPVWQRRHLDQVRPGGADPLEPSSAPPATDAEFERGPQPIGFDDLAVSNAPTAAVESGLPAPAVGDVPVEGPVAIDGGDEPPDGDARNTPDVAVAAEATAPEAEAGGDDDDEDITGEQDTDDFLTVLDQVDEPDLEPDLDPAVEPESEPVVESDSDPGAAEVPGDGVADVHPGDDHDRDDDHERG